jgi:hypothetical protein
MQKVADRESLPMLNLFLTTTLSWYIFIVMKTIKLLLPDQTHRALEQRAAAQDADIAQYCSSLLTEFLHDEPFLSASYKEHINTHQQESCESVPDTVAQIHRICRYAWLNKMDFQSSVRKTALDFKICTSTVLDKCTRRISFPTEPVKMADFVAMLPKPSVLREHLCRRFPRHKQEIAKLFGEIAPETSESPSTSQHTIEPQKHTQLTQMELVDQILNCLKLLGGAADKKVVEQELFKRNTHIFQTTWWQQLVGAQPSYAGIPRWKKHVQFARNLARSLGFLKTPKESGRGMWELTEKAKLSTVQTRDYKHENERTDRDS